MKSINCPPKHSVLQQSGRCILCLGLVLPLLAGCTAMRLHDKGKLATAQEAVKLSEEISLQSTNAFTAMEANLEVASKVRLKMHSVLSKTDLDTYLTALPRMSDADIAKQVINAIQLHQDNTQRVKALEQQAAEGVRLALTNQAIITTIVERGEAANGLSLTNVLSAVDKRISWLTNALYKIDRALDSTGLASSKGKQAAKANQILQTGYTNAFAVLRTVSDNDEVKAAQTLLLQAGQDIALAQKKQLLEMRRHLQAVQGIRKEMDEKDSAFNDFILAPAIGFVSPEEFAKYYPKPSEEILKTLQEQHSTNWPSNGTLIDCLEKNLVLGSAANAAINNADAGVGKSAQEIHKQQQKSRDLQIGALRSVAQAALATFVVEQEDMKAVESLTAELHLHSIRLSEFNAQAQWGLTHQIVQAIQVYESGGIKPEEVAQLVLLASQAIATGYVGTQL